MLQSENHTPLKVFLSLFPDENGIDSFYPVVKATFDLSNGPTLLEKQPEFVFADEYHGDPLTTSLKHPAEAMPTKPATDVFVRGHAYAPGGEPSAQTDVTFAVGTRRKTVRVFGDRIWRNGFFGNTLSNPVPFTSLPLLWERAFGGVDPTPDDGPKAHAYNPIGQGYCHRKGKRSIQGMVAANLEDPAGLLVRPNDQPTPVGFGPISPAWRPRLDYAGTYDEQWLESRSPYLPKDFDRRFYNYAPSDQIFEPYLKGGEKIEIRNATPDGKLSFTLPSLEFAVTLRFPDKTEPVEMNLDTVLIEPDQYRLTMLWRGKLKCDKRVLKMQVAGFDFRKKPVGVKGL